MTALLHPVPPPLLSLPDSRSKPKGSRDPLGFEQVWSHFGRRLVGNLTTITSSIDNFMVALLCCDYAHQAEDTAIDRIQDRFMRMEQLFGYVRMESGRGEVLGSTRAQRKLDHEECQLGSERAAQILSNQLSYGLWGLYSTALSSTGLIEADTRKPTAQGFAICNDLIPPLEGAWKEMCSRCDQGGKLPRSQLEPWLNAVVTMLANQDLRSQLVVQLLDSHSGAELQQSFYQRTLEYLHTPESDQDSGLGTFVGYLAQQDEDARVAQVAYEIQSLEPVLVIASTCFEWILGENQRDWNELLEDFANKYKAQTPPALSPPKGDYPLRQFIHDFARAFSAEDYPSAMNRLLEHNQFIMNRRGGAPWAEVRGNRLHITMPNDRPTLPESLEQLAEQWRYPYFLSSFVQIARQGMAS